MESTQSRLRKWTFRLSIAFNIIFILGWCLNYINSPSYRLGILTKDINLGFLANDSIIFKMPKGITVRDVSAQGIEAIGQFENNRFEIVITSDRKDLVNYDLPKDSLFQFGNFYSADRFPGASR